MKPKNGEAARNQALDRVSKNSDSFMLDAVSEALDLPQGEYTGEDLRVLISNKGILPHHPNAWGAVIMTLVRCGVLTKTGSYSKMKIKGSHARQTPVYFKGEIKQ